MALKEKVQFQLLVDPDDPSTLILKPLVLHTVDQGTGLKPGSVYTINLKNIKRSIAYKAIDLFML